MDAGDKALFKVQTWVGLAQWFERYPECDDGYLAEHVSELVQGWLARRPTTLFRLNEAVERHPALLSMVERHIDDLMSRERSARARENADRRCPGGAEKTCEAIVAAIDRRDRALDRHALEVTRQIQ
jgi:hypothetical protein